MSRQGFLGRLVPLPPCLREIIAPTVLNVSGPEHDWDNPRPLPWFPSRDSKAPRDFAPLAEHGSDAGNWLTDGRRGNNPGCDQGLNGANFGGQADVALPERGSR